MDSEGLLLFTNDGDFCQAVTHPSCQVDKDYLVWVRGYTRQGEQALGRPVTLDGYTIRPPRVRLLQRHGETACLEVIIHEGRNRQIRRMCSAVGLQVVRLRRSAEGPVKLGMLQPGEYRELKKSEINALRNAAMKSAGKGRAVLPARPAVPAPLKSAQILTKIAGNSEKCAKFHLWKRRERSIIQLNGGFFVKYFYKKQSALP